MQGASARGSRVKIWNLEPKSKSTWISRKIWTATSRSSNLSLLESGRNLAGKVADLVFLLVSVESCISVDWGVLKCGLREWMNVGRIVRSHPIKRVDFIRTGKVRCHTCGNLGTRIKRVRNLGFRNQGALVPNEPKEWEPRELISKGT